MEHVMWFLEKMKILKNEGTSRKCRCIAKTQFSFLADPKAYGVVTCFKINDII